MGVDKDKGLVFHSDECIAEPRLEIKGKEDRSFSGKCRTIKRDMFQVAMASF